MRSRNFLASAVLFLLSFTAAHAQSAGSSAMTYQSGASAKLGNSPALPSCATVHAEDGDPHTGPSIIRIRAQKGCVIPWHWHTPNERLIIIRGSVSIQMKDMAPQVLAPGDFAAMPAKHVHRFTALTGAEFFNVPDAAFDIHYVDPAGNEIPVGPALTAVHEAAATK